MYEKSLPVICVVFIIFIVSLFPICSSSVFKDDLISCYDIVVPDDYCCIQDALDAACEDYCIFVRSGVYNESIMFSKKGVSLIGENRNDTVISAKGFINVVGIFSDAVCIKGFSVSGCLGSGVVINGCNISVEDVVVEGCGGSGIELLESDNVTLKNNCIISNENGIDIKSSNYNLIKSNSISENLWFGIILQNSNNNTIKDNAFNENERYGAYLILSDNNIVKNNRFSKNLRVGFINWMSNNTIIQKNLIKDNLEGGLVISKCFKNTIIENEITNNKWAGLDINSSNNNSVSNNSIKNNGNYGCGFYNSNDNKITYNDIINNSYGYYLDRSYNNSILNNNFVNNDIHAYFYKSYYNHWDSNYWDDWIGLRFRFGLKRIILRLIPKFIFGKITIRSKDISWFVLDKNPVSNRY